MIRPHMASVLVDDQSRAEAFYVGTLGLAKAADIALGEGRWLTVQGGDGQGVELLLEPTGYDFARDYQRALYAQGVPAMSLRCDDLNAEVDRLTGLGVRFRGEPTPGSQCTPATAIVEDGCGNLIMLVEG